jgi:hypothetical protein
MSDPRIVLFDLETLPDLPRALRLWTTLSNYPGITLRVSSIICAGWKVLGSDEVHCINAWDFPGWASDVNDDRDLCAALYEVLKDADCVVTHNGKRFDWKFVQTRLIFHGFPPLPQLHHVDTCAEAKRHLFMPNNRLNTIAQTFTNAEKMEHEGWELWVKVHGRDPVAMKTMTEYCMKDVLVCEEVFRALRPLIKGLPNQNLFSPMKEKVCPGCGSTRIVSNGKRYTATRAYRRYQCTDCRLWSHTNLKDEVPRT